MTATFATFAPASRPLGEATARGGGHLVPAASPTPVHKTPTQQSIPDDLSRAAGDERPTPEQEDTLAVCWPVALDGRAGQDCVSNGSDGMLDTARCEGLVSAPPSLDRRHAVRRFNARPTDCPHCDGRVTEGHYRDTGAATVMPIDVCPVLFAKRARGMRA